MKIYLNNVVEFILLDTLYIEERDIEEGKDKKRGREKEWGRKKAGGRDKRQGME